MQQPGLLRLALALPPLLLLLALHLQPVSPHTGIVSTSARASQRLLLQQPAGDASHTSAHTSPHTSQHDLWTHSHVQQQQHGQQVELLGRATPWLLPPSLHLPYEGFHNDLPALLRIQRTEDKWVTVFMFSAGVSWWAMNSVYSYVIYGGSTSYIMAAPDPESLTACLQLRMPCLNMSAAGITVAPAAAANNAGGPKAHGWKSPAYYALVWAKVELVARILRTGHHVHFSDIDVVYLRDVWRSYRHVFSIAGPDAVFMKEQWQVPGSRTNLYINMFNTGVYAIRSNPRSLKFMDQWYGSGSQQAGNQPYINSFIPRADAAFGLCGSALECNLVRRAGRAALLLHPAQSDFAACPPITDDFLDPKTACSEERLFIHYICSPRGWGAKGPGSKGFMLDGHSLRLLDKQGRPVYVEAMDQGGQEDGVEFDESGGEEEGTLHDDSAQGLGHGRRHTQGQGHGRGHAEGQGHMIAKQSVQGQGHGSAHAHGQGQAGGEATGWGHTRTVKGVDRIGSAGSASIALSTQGGMHSRDLEGGPFTGSRQQGESAERHDHGGTGGTGQVGHRVQLSIVGNMGRGASVGAAGQAARGRGLEGAGAAGQAARGRGLESAGAAGQVGDLELGLEGAAAAAGRVAGMDQGLENSGAAGQLGQGARGRALLSHHPYLPCPEPVAWLWSIPEDLDQAGRPYKPDPFDDLEVT